MPVTRRALLAGAAALAQPNGGYIDAHVHVWEKDPRFTPEDLLSHARPAGVTRVVLIQPGGFGVDNSYMLAAIAKHRGVFSGVGFVDHTASNPPDFMRRLAGDGVRGFRITPRNQPETWLDHRGMAEMWKCGGDDGLAMCPLINPNALPSLERMCRRFPQTTVVIDHFARIGADGEIREEDVRRLCDLARHRRVHVKLSAFCSLGRKQYPYTDMIPLIRRLFDAFGPQRLMWGTDSPFQTLNGHTYAGSLELVRDRLDFLSRDDREWILRKTAEKIFYA